LRPLFDIHYPVNNKLPVNVPIIPIAPTIEGNYQLDITWEKSSYYGYFSNPGLPQGLMIDRITGVISGTPTQLSPLKEYTIRLRRQLQGKTVESQKIINLSVGVPTTGTTFRSSCSSFAWNGTTYTESGTYEKIFTNQYGYDSTDILRLTILQPTTSLTTKYISKSNLPFLWNGLRLDSSGSYTKIKTNFNGCDSITNLKLYVAPILSYPIPNPLTSGITMKPLFPLNLGDAVPQSTGQVKTFTSGVQPNNIAVDKNNNIFFSDVNGNLFKIDQNGLQTTVASGLGLLGGLVVDNSGNILIGQFSSNAIVKISPDGTQTKLAIGGASGIGIDAMGNIYFSEFSNHRIRKIGTDGIVKTFADRKSVV
jgi:hypothetical protein